MLTIRATALIFGVFLSCAAMAETFDGSVPLQCTVSQAHDCLPGAGGGCKPMQPESTKPLVVSIDVPKKAIRTPFRTSILPILHHTTNAEALVLQGADLLFAWGALINKKSGALTIAVTDRKGAYVIFGQCKAADAKGAM
ncbi:MAG TPA: hypothetical protein VEZ88_09460 [Steroidobacteraceae bacterium]|nr:hypothetical protein [Steroidobacteraceae bacterium]